MEDGKIVGKDENDTCKWFNDKMLTTVAPTTSTVCFVTPFSLFSLPSLTASLSLTSFSFRSVTLTSLTSTTTAPLSHLFLFQFCNSFKPPITLSFGHVPYVDFFFKKIKSLTATSGSERSCENWLLKYHYCIIN